MNVQRLHYYFSLSDENVQIWLNSINTASGTNYLLEELTTYQSWDLGAIMIGDLQFRVDAVDESKFYADAGADVYVGFFDMSGSLGFLFYQDILLMHG